MGILNRMTSFVLNVFKLYIVGFDFWGKFDVNFFVWIEGMDDYLD